MMRSVHRRYRVGPRFVAAIERQQGMSIDELLAEPPGSTRAMWTDFTLTTNRRGIEIAFDLARRLSGGLPTLTGRRTLDVGCGHGGAAVGCARLGAEAVGVDIDETFLELARANAADSGLPVLIEQGDLMDSGRAGRLGTFDGVTANDVLEHVDDARKGVAVIAGLLRPGGVAIMTIPNGDAAAFVAADGHYRLAGLTLLRHRPDAVAYHAAKYPWDRYSVGNYHSLNEYLTWLEEAQLTVLAVEAVEPVTDLDGELRSAEEAVRRAAADGDLPAGVRSALRAGLGAYGDRTAEARQRGSVLLDVAARFWRITCGLGAVHRSVKVVPSPVGAAVAGAGVAARRAIRSIPGVPGIVGGFRRLRPGC